MVATWNIWLNKLQQAVLPISLLLLMGCGGTAPQRPTFHGSQHSDTTVVQLLSLNQHMAEEADRQLVRYAQEGYVLMEENYWVKGLDSHGDALQENEYISLEASIYTMQGQLLTHHQAEVQVGKVDEIKAIVSVLPEMSRGKSVSMLVPWYLAFGSAGNQEVGPYENVRIELTIK